MMKLVSAVLFISVSASAQSPMKKMNFQLEGYKDIMAPSHCADASNNSYTSSDHGLIAEVDCEIKCKNRPAQKQRTIGSFVPTSYGLTPGNGSTSTNTMWRSLTVTLNIWAEEKCMEEADSICSNIISIEDVNVIGMQSGEWKNNKKLSCEETTVTLSPFDNSVNSNKVSLLFNEQFAYTDYHSLPIYNSIFAASEKKHEGECKNKVEASLCFGDCIQVLAGEKKETLATPEPLGRSKDSWCMDGFVSVIQNQKQLSDKIKIKMCEAYFWSNVLHSNGLASSCAAIRGTVECESLIKSLKN